MTRLTARQKVLAYLNKQHSASAVQIGRAIGMSAPDVRHHLSILLGDGRIIMLGMIRNKKRGRPIKVYGLSGKALGDNLAMLASSLLDETLLNRSGSIQQVTLRAVAKRLSDKFGKIDSNKLNVKRLGNLVDKFNERHYQARWEAGAEGPRILFARCPYAAIIENHPELCQMDGFILEEELDGQASQLAKIDQKPGGYTNCVFLIR